MTTSMTVSERFTAKTTPMSFGAMACSAALILLSLGTLAGAPARADEVTGDSRSHHIMLADLDLSTHEGQQLATERIRDAARTLCLRATDELDLSHHANYVKCVDSAVTTAGARLQAQLSQRAVSRLALADVK